MTATDVEQLVRRYLRRLDDVAAAESLPHTFRNELVGEVRELVQANLRDHDAGDIRAARAVLLEIGTPDAMIAAIAASTARPALKPRISGHAVAAAVCGAVWLVGLGSLFAIVLGHRALKSIRLSDGRTYGDQLALGAIFMGWVGLSIPLLVALPW
jgi:hypothetical protein